MLYDLTRVQSIYYDSSLQLAVTYTEDHLKKFNSILELAKRLHWQRSVQNRPEANNDSHQTELEYQPILKRGQ